MKIEVLGPGCPKCFSLMRNAQAALSELGVDAELVKVTDINRIADYEVWVTPALVIDGVVKVSGRVATKDEIKSWLSACING
ncbi:MAG: thioredoxin family protein [Bacillota bacterium]